MPIRPIDIRRKEFRNGFRGYDANQVDDFLDTVADEFERTYNENQRMREEVSGLRDRLQQFEDLEGSIRAALVHAEQAANDLRRSANREAEDVRASARREADATIRDAQNRSHQMLADSAARIERVQDSYEALQDAKRDFGNDFRYLLKTYMDMMESMEVSSAREIEASLRGRLDTESIAVVREAASQQESPDAPEDRQPQPDEPAFGTAGAAAGAAGADAADLDDPGATRPIETEPPSTEPESSTAYEGGDAEATGPLADDALADDALADDALGDDGEEPRELDQETQVLRPGESVTFGAEEEEREAAGGEAAETTSAGGFEEPVATEPETEPSTASGGTAQEATTDEPGAADEVEQEEPALAEESRSQEFFDRGDQEQGQESRISRASRFLRRRD